MLMRVPLWPLSSRFRWKLASGSPGRVPTSAAKAPSAAGSPASSLAKACEIASSEASSSRLRGQRLEGAQRLGPAPAAARSPTGRPRKSGNLLRSVLADADARAELLVRRFQPRGDVDRVAIGRVVEEAAAAEIADDRRPGVARRCGWRRARRPCRASASRNASREGVERRARRRPRAPRDRAGRPARRTAHAAHRRRSWPPCRHARRRCRSCRRDIR